MSDSRQGGVIPDTAFFVGLSDSQKIYAEIRSAICFLRYPESFGKGYDELLAVLRGSHSSTGASDGEVKHHGNDDPVEVHRTLLKSYDVFEAIVSQNNSKEGCIQSWRNNPEKVEQIIDALKNYLVAMSITYECAHQKAKGSKETHLDQANTVANQVGAAAGEGASVVGEMANYASTLFQSPFFSKAGMFIHNFLPPIAYFFYAMAALAIGFKNMQKLFCSKSEEEREKMHLPQIPLGTSVFVALAVANLAIFSFYLCAAYLFWHSLFPLGLVCVAVGTVFGWLANDCLNWWYANKKRAVLAAIEGQFTEISRYLTGDVKSIAEQECHNKKKDVAWNALMTAGAIFLALTSCVASPIILFSMPLLTLLGWACMGGYALHVALHIKDVVLHSSCLSRFSLFNKNANNSAEVTASVSTSSAGPRGEGLSVADLSSPPAGL